MTTSRYAATAVGLLAVLLVTSFPRLGSCEDDPTEPPRSSGAANLANELQRAYDLMTSGKWQEAASAYRAVLARYPDNEEARLNLANSYSGGGRDDEALAVAQDAVTRFPKSGNAHLVLAEILHATGNNSAAIQAFLTAGLFLRDQPYPRFRAGELLIAQAAIGEKDVLVRANAGMAIQSLTRAIALKPDYADAHYALGLAYSLLESPRRSDEAFRKALAYDPAMVPAMIRVSPAQAIELINSSKGTYRFTDGDYQRLGSWLVGRGQLVEANTLYTKAVTQLPDSASLHLDLARMGLRLGEWDAATISAQRAAKFDPGLTDAWLVLGKVMGAMGSWPEAVKAFQIGLINDAEDPAAPLLHLAIAYDASGNHAKAADTWATLTRVIPTFPDAEAVTAGIRRHASALGRLGVHLDSKNASPQQFTALAEAYEGVEWHSMAANAYRVRYDRIRMHLNSGPDWEALAKSMASGPRRLLRTPRVWWMTPNAWCRFADASLSAI